MLKGNRNVTRVRKVDLHLLVPHISQCVLSVEMGNLVIRQDVLIVLKGGILTMKRPRKYVQHVQLDLAITKQGLGGVDVWAVKNTEGHLRALKIMDTVIYNSGHLTNTGDLKCRANQFTTKHGHSGALALVAFPLVVTTLMV